MNATTYSGNSGTQAVVNTDQGTTGFKPDLVWVKDRSYSNNHILVDSNRGSSSGVYATLFSNRTDAEQTTNSGSETSYGIISAINTNGFTAAPGAVNAGATNLTGHNYVGWQWQAGQGTNVSNTSGTITSSVSANTTAGFSIVTYTGTGVAATVGHGLGVAPQFIIVKNRSAVANWITYHTSVGATAGIALSLTDAAFTTSTYWNNIAPTSSVFSVGTAATTNGSTNTMVAYCWTPIAGYSAFGSYTGNGSADGPFVYLGFRPRWIMFKAASGTSVGADGYWNMIDTSRGPFNYYIPRLSAQSSAAEDLNTTQWVDILSNGFKMRNGGTSNNNSGTVYIYAAFAENPFKFSNAR
jgi:hypothetical protein